MTSKPSLSRTIARLIRAHPGLWALSSVTASILFYAFPLFPGLVVRAILDRLVATPVLDGALWRLVLLLGGIYCARGVTLLVANLAENACLIRAGILVERNVLAGVLRRPAARALPESVGDSLGRLHQDQRQVTLLHTWIADPIGQAVALGAALFVLARISVWLTLLIAVPVVVAAAGANALSQRVQSARDVLQKALGARTAVLADLFSGVSAIQLGGARREAVEHLDEANEKVRKAVLRDILLGEAIDTFGNQLGQIGTAALLFLAAGMLRDGTFSVGDLALFVSYVGHLAQVAGMAGWFSTQFRRGAVSLRRLHEMIPGEHPAEITARRPLHLRGELPLQGGPPPTAADPLESLEFIGLTCRHGDTNAGVRDVDLKLSRGTVTVVTGEVGSGKTTLLRAVLGLLPVQRGEVLWNGRVIEPATELVPPRAAYSPQVPRCFTASLEENVRLGHPATEQEVRDALDAAVMETDLARLPDGLLTEVGPRGLRLSGGQLLRTAAARMFVRRPELMVVDDLSSGLDVDTEAEIWRRLRESGGTWLIVSHRPAALALADQIVVLTEGRVDAIGSPTEVASHPFVARVRSGRESVDPLVAGA